MRWRSRSSRRAAASRRRRARRASDSAAASEPASGSESANAATVVAGDHAGDPALDERRRAGLEDRVAAEPLQGERGLGLGGDGGQRLAEQAELERGRVPRRLVRRAAEEAAQQAVVPERLHQRPVDGAVDGRDREQVVGGDGADAGDVVLLVRGEAACSATLLRLDNFRQERTMLPERMRIAVIGGGPGGLYFSALAQQLAALTGEPHEITVWERNAADDTFGFGVVFSDETLGGIEHADPEIFRADAGGVRGLGRHRRALQGRGRHQRRPRLRGDVAAPAARDPAGPLPRARRHAPLPHRRPRRGASWRATHDLVVAADGLNSAVRAAYAETFRPTLEERDCKYIWLGTDKVFDAFKFYIAQTPAGVMQIHGYPYDATGSTFIVEMTSAVWEKAGFAAYADRDWAPGESDEQSIERIRELFADVLDGHEVHANNSRWINFTTVRNEHWVARQRRPPRRRRAHRALLDRLGHQAGDGGRAHPGRLPARGGRRSAAALAAYETERKAVVLSTQRAAQASLEWFENLDQYVHQDPLQFGFNIMTRSRRVTYDNLRLRDPEFVARCDEWFAGHDRRPPTCDRPCSSRCRLGPLELVNRVVVSPMDMYVADDGLTSDFHLVHLGGKALGGAGLVMTEMVCVSPEGRITPGCAGIWDDEQQAAWRRVTDFVHTNSAAKIGLQLGHSGGKGSTKLMWEGIDEPLDEGNWEVVAASPVAYRDGRQPGAARAHPRRDGRDPRRVRRRPHAAAPRRASTCSSCTARTATCSPAFLSPVTNRRTDEYGGDVDGRLRFPLEVFTAMREVWPADRPMTVRISATDWVEDGQTLDDALAVARAFVDAGAAAIDVSTGQVTVARAAGVRPVVPDAVRRRDPQPTRRAHHRGRRDLAPTTTSTRS